MKKKAKEVFPFNEDLPDDAGERERTPSRDKISAKRPSASSNRRQLRKSSNASGHMQSDTAASSQGLKESLYALRRANKTRRQ